MISLRCVKSYCCDDISLIENYDKAINDTTQKWSCHHRLEIDMNLSYEELKEKNLYYNRPASELIFLTNSEHITLHRLNEYKHGRINKTNNMKKFWANDEFRINHSKKMKAWHSTHKNPAFGHKWMSNGVNRAFPAPEEFEYYKSKGYHFGRK